MTGIRQINGTNIYHRLLNMKKTLLVKEASESPIKVLGKYSRNYCNVLVLFLYHFLTPLTRGQCYRLDMRLYEPLIKPRTISYWEKEKKKEKRYQSITWSISSICIITKPIILLFPVSIAIDPINSKILLTTEIYPRLPFFLRTIAS